MAAPALRPGIYYVADLGLQPDQTLLLNTATAAAAGGAIAIQLRAKQLDKAAFILLARQMQAALAAYRVPIIINDAIEVALAVQADGLHIGQKDGDPTMVRGQIGPEMLLGLSVEGLDQLSAALNAPVDYLAASPVYATSTKTDTAPPLGLDGLLQMVRATHLPVVAIGGINLTNAEAIGIAGARAAAIVSAIANAPDPAATTRQLQETFMAGYTLPKPLRAL